jgi:hypothetical protein
MTVDSNSLPSSPEPSQEPSSVLPDEQGTVTLPASSPSAGSTADSAYDPAKLLGQLLDGFQATQALHVAARLGLVDALRDGPKTSSALADRFGAHEPSLRRLLGFLTTLGVLTQDGMEGFATTPVGDLLRADHPESDRPWALLLGSPAIWRPWGALYEAVMSGRPAFEQIYGEPFFSYLGHDPEQAALFNAAMSSDTATMAEVLDAYDFSGAATIVDIGGGHGALLRGILERAPQAKGILFDLPSVVAEAEAEHVSNVEPTTEPGYERVGGDMFASVPAGGDLYILKRILHDWSDAEGVQILSNCRKAMGPKGKVLLIESIRQPAKQADPATAVDLMMLVLVTGRERGEDEFRHLLAEAGFRLTRIIPAGWRSLIEAVSI